MLTLTRKLGESIHIGEDITIVVSQIKGKQVRISIDAPRDQKILRGEHFAKEDNQEEENFNTSLQ